MPAYVDIGSGSHHRRRRPRERARAPPLLARRRARETRGRETEARRELAGDARVLAKYRVRPGQRAEGARRKVFAGAEGSSHHEEFSAARLCHRAAKIAWGDFFAIIAA